MGKLSEKYRASGSPGTFYETYLKLLFYEVFNKGKDTRISAVSVNPLYKEIPYLNGGLFRQVIPSESLYNISNEGVELVLENVLGRYDFGLEPEGEHINPDMLGYIFEKTINFISGAGTNQQKMQGAYYTPDDVVSFIIEETAAPAIFNAVVGGLRKAGWNDNDLKGYDSLEILLNSENMPRNPIHVRRMIEAIDDIRVVDPACGSGHFLTAMLSMILRVKESLIRSIGEKVDRYKIKSEIIRRNLYGVDLDENAVEIARLRLWLSLIEEVHDSRNISTLPNIDFKIVPGNALVGWLNESLLIHPLTYLSDDELVQRNLDFLGARYSLKIEEIRRLLEKKNIEGTIAAYEKLVDMHSSECGEPAVKAKEAVDKIRDRLYGIINGSYVNFVQENSNLKKNDLVELSRSLSERKPFHWKVDFWDVFTGGGFDIVIGNPPYIEDGNNSQVDIRLIESEKKSGKAKKGIREALLYFSKDCGNTHAYFIERSLKLLKANGQFGFIVPISL